MTLEPSKDLAGAMERLEARAICLEADAEECRIVADKLPSYSQGRAMPLYRRADDCARRAADIRTVLPALREAMK